MFNLFQVTIFVLRAGLAAVLVAAGAAKFADITGFTTTLVDLGLPARFRRVVRSIAILFPCVEVGLGLAIISTFWPQVVNTAVLFLTCGFSIVTCIALYKAPQVTCRCFGSLSDSQFNRNGLIRSLLLTVCALVVWGSESVVRPQFGLSLSSTGLLVAIYVIFALAVMQAAKTIALVKERIAV